MKVIELHQPFAINPREKIVEFFPSWFHGSCCDVGLILVSVMRNVNRSWFTVVLVNCMSRFFEVLREKATEPGHRLKFPEGARRQLHQVGLDGLSEETKSMRYGCFLKWWYRQNTPK